MDCFADFEGVGVEGRGAELAAAAAEAELRHTPVLWEPLGQCIGVGHAAVCVEETADPEQGVVCFAGFIVVVFGPVWLKGGDGGNVVERALCG